MNGAFYVIPAIIITAPLCFGLGYFLRRQIAEKKIKSAEERADQIVFEAKKSC
jgi:uncharacterized membrane protein YdjX (TVP38/TMEM64 family)